VGLPFWKIEIRADNISWLRACCRRRFVFDPYSEKELLRLDLAIAMGRYGRDWGRVAEFLLPGRQHWGLWNSEGP
jgi:hypothetical protein